MTAFSPVNYEHRMNKHRRFICPVEQPSTRSSAISRSRHSLFRLSISRKPSSFAKRQRHNNVSSVISVIAQLSELY